MTPQERRLWSSVQRRAQDVSPALAAAMLRAFARLRDSMTEAELARAIALGFAERIVAQLVTEAILDVALLPVRTRLRESIAKAVPYYAKTLPPPIRGEVTVAFDILSPNVVDAIRALETRVMTTLKADIRESVRLHVEASLRSGASPRKTARTLRSVIGMPPHGEIAAQNFEKALRGEGKDPLAYKLRDKRFDATLKKGPLTEAQIEKMVTAYRKRMIAMNADTVARTAALDAQKLAQRLAWEDAIARGEVDRGSLRKTWRGTLDDRERPEHIALEGATVGFDEPFPNGEITPGESTYNCRCLAVVSVR